MLSTPLLLLTVAASAFAQPAIPTAQYDNSRTGANLNETILTPRNVNAAQFGRAFMLPVDGDVYAQPLYVPRLLIPGKGVHNVVFVATEHNGVYAFDAAGQPETPLWQVSFINPGAGVDTVPAHAVRCSFIAPELGITPTPVIDTASGTIYVLARTVERNRNGEPLYYQRLHALEITTGRERTGSPVAIRASVRGSTLFGLFQRETTFHALPENPRAAMLLSKGNVYMAWGSSCDAGPYHGWVLAYDARTLKQTGVLNTSPDADESGIWQSDAGIAADGEGNVYAVTGNGKFDASQAGGRDFGDSAIKLGFRNGALVVRDYFTPFNEAALNRGDADLGSSGPVLLPDQPGPHPHVLIAAGKDGVIYAIDRDRMGKYQSGSDSHALQTLPSGGSGLYGAPAYWNGHLYYAANDDVLKDFAVERGQVGRVPVHRGTFLFKSGAIPSISANGTKDGIVWAVVTKSYNARETFGVLQAYDAADVGRMLYTSEENLRRDGPGLVLRFTMPMVAGGRVYIGMKRGVYVYGLLGGGAKTR